jgi:hypothetical protein
VLLHIDRLLDGVNPLSGRPANSFTIGEDMKNRVIPAAKDLGSEYLHLPEKYGTGYLGKDIIDPAAMNYNEAQIDIKIQQNSYFYDVGPKGPSIKSPFYEMEVGKIMYNPKTYNVQIQQIYTIRVLIIYK